MRSRATSSRSRATFSPSSSGLLMRSSLPPAHSTVALTTPEAPAPWGLTDTLDEAREGPQPGADVRPGTQLTRGFACQRRNVRTAAPSSRMTRSSAAAASTFLLLAARDAARRRRATWPRGLPALDTRPGERSPRSPRARSAQRSSSPALHPGARHTQLRHRAARHFQAYDRAVRHSRAVSSSIVPPVWRRSPSAPSAAPSVARRPSTSVRYAARRSASTARCVLAAATPIRSTPERRATPTTSGGVESTAQ